MEKHLRNTAKILEKGRVRAYISRVAWGDLYDLVRAALEQLEDLSLQKDQIGSLYLSSNTQYPPFDEKRFRFSNITNQIQINTGWRQLNVSRANHDKKEHPKAELLAESGATLWYSQDITGAVCVFVSPYKSEAMSTNEDNIIIARYSCPTKISKKHVAKHFSTYFKYCAVTSAHGNLGLKGYIYRLHLKFKDIRNTNKIRSELFGYAEKIAILLVGILATLYAGGKIFT